MEKYIIGIDIGGTKTAVILGCTSGEGDRFEMLERICFETEAAKGPEQAISRMISVIHELICKKTLRQEQILGIGISCGGPLDPVKGLIQSPPNLYGWNDVPIVSILEKEFGIPTYLQNDANACALAEWKFGAARGYRDVAFLTCGTGLGAGLILNGQIYNGANGMAGEVGHVRLTETGPVGYGKAGSFEGFCSGNGIAQVGRLKVLEQLQKGEKPAFCPRLECLEQLTAKTIAEAAEAGDPLALDIYATSGHYLGIGLSILIDILNPEIIVLGSVYERSGNLLKDAMMKAIEKETLELSRKGCKIVPAQLGNSIGDYAALSVALDAQRQEVS